MLPSISLIVPAKNEEKVIGKCLDSLLDLDYPRKKLEIIVSVDGSTDNTVKICRKYGRRIKVIESEPKSCKAAALNEVIPKARGEIIGIYDADCIVDRNCLKEVAKNFENNETAGVCGNLK
jgi:cellulose synthase/poly-beta-1,6-N-acetylglucosamine synthase-like glycosyltransferase